MVDLHVRKIYSQTRSTGPERPSLLHLRRTTSERLQRTLYDHVRSASALSPFKKSLVANLSAKRQLSVAKLPTERIFSLAKRDFLVANGRMAADFSSPEEWLSWTITQSKRAYRHGLDGQPLALDREQVEKQRLMQFKGSASTEFFFSSDMDKPLGCTWVETACRPTDILIDRSLQCFLLSCTG